MEDEIRIAGCLLRVVEGDITTQQVDAVVNAANRSLLGGGGVDGAIHRRGGPAVLGECEELRRTRFPDGLPTGEAVATTAGSLAATWVIHAVGPVWRGGGGGEPDALSNAYRSALREARRLGARTVAFPSISTGAYAYPIEAAAKVACRALRAELDAHPGALDEVRLVAFSSSDAAVYRRAVRAVTGDDGNPDH